MKERLQLWWEKIHTSLWFLPLLLSIAGGILSGLALEVPDASLRTWRFIGWLLHEAGAKHGHELLSSLLTSMITMTALAMSLTMVVLSLAAQSLGPRLIPFFMGSRLTQFTLGIFMGTIVYLLMTLRVLPEDIPLDQVPHVAITLGSGLVLLSLLMLIFFIDHLARSTASDTVIRYVGHGLSAHIERYVNQYAKGQREGALMLHSVCELSLGKTGYVQTIDDSALLDALQQVNGFLSLTIRPGDYVLLGSPAGYLAPDSLRKNAQVLQKLQTAIEVGDEPTPLQDIEFTIRQLVEIALRALSPSLYDPFTAMRVTDKLSSALQQVVPLTADFYGAHDPSGLCRLSLPISSLPRLLDVAFSQICHAGATMPEVLTHLLNTLTALAKLADHPAHLQAIRAHGHMIVQAAEENLKEQAVIDRVKEAFDKFSREALQKQTPENFR